MPLISGIPPAPQLGRCPGQPPLPESVQPCRATCSRHHGVAKWLRNVPAWSRSATPVQSADAGRV